MAQPASSRTMIALPELQDARRKRSGFGPAHRAPDRQAATRLLESTLTNAGIDLEPLKALHGESEAAARQHIARTRAEADDHSSATLGSVQQTLKAWRTTIGNPTTLDLPPDTAQRFLLDTAAEISITAGIAPASTQIAPLNNSVQFQFDTTNAGGFEEVGFGFLWGNPSDKFALVNVDGYLVLNAVCQAIVEGGFFPDDRQTTLTVDANLHIHQLWDDPPSSPPFQASQTQRALTLSLDNGGWFAIGEIASENLFRGFDLQYSLLAVPPRAFVLIEVACTLSYNNAHGEANFVFLNLGRHVLAPAVLVTLLS